MKTKIEIRKNIMKTNRGNGRKQYTISIPQIIGQLLQIPDKRKLYIYDDMDRSYRLTTSNPNHESQEERSIFPNGNQNYFTFPVKLLKDMKEEQINNVLFTIDFDNIDEATQRRGIISLNIE